MRNGDEEICISREFRTPFTEAARSVSVACNVFVKAIGQVALEGGEDPGEFFFSKIFKEKWDDNETDGDKEEKLFFDDLDKHPEGVDLALLRVLWITISFAVQAMKAEKNSSQAWSLAVSAAYWAGLIKATPWGSITSTDAASQLAKMRHAENYALADDALKYWRENIDPHLSAAKAANDLVRVVPLSHKKLAEIISAARKDMSKA